MDNGIDGPFIVSAGSGGAIKFGGILKEYRQLANLTPIELAEKSRIHESFVRGIERGAQAPSLSTAQTIFSHLGEMQGVWVSDSKDFDLVITDPRNERDVSFQFKAAIRGQNRRIDVADNSALTHDEQLRLACLDLSLSHFTEMPMSDIIERARRFETFVKDRGGNNG